MGDGCYKRCLDRLDYSWSCLRLLSVHKVKIMCLSATADEYLIDRIGQYLGMGNYKILGSTDNYPIPQVSITITRINADAISIQVVNCCLQLKSTKSHTFQIHVIAFTKKDAENIILSLKESNISCLSLTSDNLQADKEDIMTLWGQGRHLILVSTYVDGIDSPFTEDVIIAGCSHSVVNVIQGIGRIRRPCQAQKEATLHILSSENYFHHQDSLIDIVTKVQDADLLPDDEEAVVYFQKLFHITGYHTFIRHTGCLMKYLFLQLGITSENCHLCSNCYQKNCITKSANRAKELLKEEDQQRSFVLDALVTLQSTCIICKLNECKGTCWADVNSRCFSCHASCTSKNDFHRNKECAAYQVQTDGKCCMFCFLLFSEHIKDGTAIRDHQNGRCIYQDKIKRILLYKVLEEKTKV